MTIYTLHGFLGLPSDWKPFEIQNILPISILEIGKPSSHFNLEKWATTFNQKFACSEKKHILLGYSLGGRLAMHALLQNPEQFSAAIFISSHTGLDPLEKEKRLQQDLVWAKQFKDLPWDELMKRWNSQSVFSEYANPFLRKESDFIREELASMLFYWSIAKQENLKEQLSKVQIPILWIAGEKDLAYKSLADKMSFAHPMSEIWISENAGHRVPWEKPKAFTQKINRFIERIQHDHCDKSLGNNPNL